MMRLKSELRQLVALSALAFIGWCALARLMPLPAERFHALLPPLWFAWFALWRKKPTSLGIVAVGGVLLGLVLWAVGSSQARIAGGRLPLSDALWQLYFTLGLFVLYAALSAALTSLLKLIPAAREAMKTKRGRWLHVVRALVALAVIAPYIYTAYSIHKFKYANITDPYKALKLPFQDVRFAAADGMPLRGWYIPCAGSHSAVVVCHGIGANKSNVLGVVPFLHRAGFNVFLFDQRGHGDSGGHTVSYGVYESRDVAAAVGWTAREPGVRGIGLYAFSMGGSSVLHAFGSGTVAQVGAVVLDSTFADLPSLARVQMAFLPDAVARPVLKMISFDTWLELGFRLESVTPYRFIAAIAPRPLLLIHGTADTLIPLEQARHNFAAARQPKTLYLVVGAGHVQCYAVAGAAYERRVGDFFKKALNATAIAKPAAIFGALS